MSEDRARAAAYDAVRAVEQEGAYANLVMPTVLRTWSLTGRDAAFATELAYGSLRMQGWYDAIIERAAKRQVHTLDAAVRRCLWLGAHQALNMRVPAHASVSQTVDQVRRHAGGGAAKFANAVMRRITERDAPAWQALLAPGTSRRDIGMRHSHPSWVVNALAAALDADGRAHELEALLASHNAPAKIALAARPGIADTRELLDTAGTQSGRWSPQAVTLEGGDPGAIVAVTQGRAGVQDEASQVVALALAAHSPVAAGERWLDMCAGPGGKASLLGAHAATDGAHLDALELHAHRVDLVKASVRALPAQAVSVHQADAREWRGGPYDRILLDAPCTGLGALRRRPEARWRRTEQDLEELTGLQAQLLAQAARLLTPDGVIAYVTCSPVLAETRDIVAGATELTAVDARPAIATVTGTDAGQWGPGPQVQWWPHVHGTDAMYLALLRRA
ncbi:MAG: transcription antitermination factor NusB [Demequina sp.]